MTKPRNFDKAAAAWDAKPLRVKLALDVAESIIREIRPTTEMTVMDFGCGTGLVTLRLAPLVQRITGVDSSQGMLDVLNDKVKEQGLTNVGTQLVDFDRGGMVEGKFQLIVSSMTMHHVPDTAAMLRQLFDLLLPGGQMAVADLDQEDGSFHSDNTGVFHFGFSRAQMIALLEQTGFREIRATTAASMVKEIAGQEQREFPVFLVMGRK